MAIRSILVYPTLDKEHPSKKKVAVKITGIPGRFWCTRNDDIAAFATKYAALIMDWPEHLINAIVVPVQD